MLKREYVTLIVGPLVAIFLPAAQAIQIRVTDGDTIRIGDERIRILNIDAPEMAGGAECDAERRLALVAKERLTQILAVPVAQINIQRDGKDRFGRTLARITVRGSDVGEMLVSGNVAVRWAGRQHDWCVN